MLSSTSSENSIKSFQCELSGTEWQLTPVECADPSTISKPTKGLESARVDTIEVRPSNDEEENDESCKTPSTYTYDPSKVFLKMLYGDTVPVPQRYTLKGPPSRIRLGDVDDLRRESSGKFGS